MRKCARMGLKPFDLALIAALVFLAGSWWALGFSGSRDPAWVQVYTAQGLYREVPLGEDGDVRVPGPLGESLVEICSGEASMVWSPCPNKLCMHMGAASRPGDSIVCVPNRVSVVIRSARTDTDAVSY
ncbi:MAG: NusG domain II-containing protein [Desulfomonilia bacterium]|jgi:hypothetical protein|nr:NusG domain II-containing protein [Deltaproteobacteria bacterium]MDX9761882.1 NusG domain II-containing protein [Desulfomonilia bacterium]HPW67954.1 NusG domain II-containing protein [Deltaproteobacteria bacterium]